MLIELFNEDNACRSVPEGFLAKFAKQIDDRMPLYREAIKPAKTAFEEAIMKEPLPAHQYLILLCTTLTLPIETFSKNLTNSAFSVEEILSPEYFLPDQILTMDIANNHMYHSRH